MQTWIKRIRRTTKARDETDLPWMKKMKGERVEEERNRREEEWNADSEGSDHIPLIHPSTAIPSARAPLKLPDQVRHHPEKSTGSLGRGPPRKSGRLGGVSALGARTIFRLSLRECQPDRERNKLKRTPSASGSRPWSRGREGRWARRSFLPAALEHAHVVLHSFQRQRRAESVVGAFKDVPRVTRDVTRPESRGVGAGKREKSRTWCDRARSPFGRP